MDGKQRGRRVYLLSRKVIPGATQIKEPTFIWNGLSQHSLMPLWSAAHFKGFSPERALAGALSAALGQPNSESRSTSRLKSQLAEKDQLWGFENFIKKEWE